MSVNIVKMENASSEELGERSTVRSPGRRSAPPKQPLALRLWGLLQPLARLWGLITAVGKCVILNF